MPKLTKKKGFIIKFRNYFITGVVVLIPIGITVYLTLFIIKISSKILPKEINPNHYLPYDIPGLEILISFFIITLIKRSDNSELPGTRTRLIASHSSSSIGPS